MLQPFAFPPRRGALPCTLGAALCLLAPAWSAHAAIVTWDGGGGDNLFGTAQNWNPDTAPSSQDDLVFAGTTRLTPSNNYSPDFFDFRNVTFASNAGAFTIGGNNIGVNGSLTNNSISLQTLTSNVAFRTSASVTAAAGSLTFSGANQYIDAASLTVTTGVGATVNFNNLQDGGSTTTTGVTYAGSGTVILNKNSSYSAKSTLTGGTLRLVDSKTNSGGGGKGNNTFVTSAGTTLEFAVSTSTTVQLDGYGGGAISGNGTFLKTGPGALLLGGSQGGNIAMTLAAGTFIDVQGGTLRNDYGRENWTNNLASLNVASGALVDTWDGIGGITVDALTGAGTVTHTSYNTNNTLVTAVLTVGKANGSGTFSGTLTDSDVGGGGGTHYLGLTKVGTGTETLTGANNFRGVTVISGGTLSAAANGALGQGTTGTPSISISGSATLLLENAAATDRVRNTAPITLAGGTIFKGSGVSEGSTTADGLGSLSLTATGSLLDFSTGTPGTLTFDAFAPGSFTLTIANWTGTPGAAGTAFTDRLIFSENELARLSSFVFSGYQGATQFDLGNGFYEITPLSVPEPSSALLGLFSAGLLAIRCRRRS